jgi:hypothetical protein
VRDALLVEQLCSRISITCYVAGQNEWTAFADLFPVPGGLSDTCTEMAQICQCDADGQISGVITGFAGGCLEKRNPPSTSSSMGDALELKNFELAFPLCLVPNECEGDERVASAQALISSSLKSRFGEAFDWEQPSKFQLRECSLTEQVSDECDPEDSQLRSNLYSFATVFVLQVVVIMISKAILRYKLESAVKKSNRDRIKSRGTDPSLIRLAEKYLVTADEADTAGMQPLPLLQQLLVATSGGLQTGLSQSTYAHDSQPSELSVCRH